jgi:hypothetical protein
MHIYDVTDDYLPPSDRTSEDLLGDFDLSGVQVDRKEVYPRYDQFNTPTGQAAFITQIHRFHIGRRALVLLAGGSVKARLPASVEPGKLRVRVCLANDLGDGVHGRLTATDERGERTLFDSAFVPAPGRNEGAWQEESIDLSEYRGRPVELKLETYNAPGRNTVADWLAWSLVRVSG